MKTQRNDNANDLETNGKAIKGEIASKEEVAELIAESKKIRNDRSAVTIVPKYIFKGGIPHKLVDGVLIPLKLKK